jgi:hypothetical protein
MGDKPTNADAELILKLYDLRREPEMRKARQWWLTKFSPESADDAMKVGMAMGSQENNWLRQVVGYWEMAASLVLHGTLNQDLFMEGSFSGEMFVIFSKIQPFLEDLRQKMQNPKAFGNMEKLIMTAKGGPERLKQTQERLAMFRKMAQTAKAS